MHTKTERGNRVFPASDHASDVIAALSGRLKKSGVKVMLHAEVKELLTEALPGAQIACEGEAGKGAPCWKREPQTGGSTGAQRLRA